MSNSEVQRSLSSRRRAAALATAVLALLGSTISCASSDTSESITRAAASSQAASLASESSAASASSVDSRSSAAAASSSAAAQSVAAASSASAAASSSAVARSAAAAASSAAAAAAAGTGDEAAFRQAIAIWGDGLSTISITQIVALAKQFCVLYSPSDGGDNMTQFVGGLALFVKSGTSPADSAISSKLAVELFCPEEQSYFDAMKASLTPPSGG